MPLRSLIVAVVLLLPFAVPGASAKSKAQTVPLPALKVVVIEDPDGLADPTAVLQLLGQGFKISERRIRPDQAEAKTIITRTGLSAFPAFLVKEAGLKGLSRERILYFQKMGQFQKKGGWYFLPPGFVTERTLLARPRVPRRLDVFIMSLCPYSNGAMRGISFAVKEKKMPPDLQLFVHYTLAANSVSRTAQGVSIVLPLLSLHGGPEVEEDIRQLVIEKYFHDRWAKYLFLRSYNFDSTYWDDAAKGADIPEGELKRHVKEEGEKLLRENAVFAAELGIMGTPTFLWENRTFISAATLTRLTDIPVEVTGNCMQK